jgi:hypothetical protein
MSETNEDRARELSADLFGISRMGGLISEGYLAERVATLMDDAEARGEQRGRDAEQAAVVAEIDRRRRDLWNRAIEFQRANEERLMDECDFGSGAMAQLMVFIENGAHRQPKETT